MDGRIMLWRPSALMRGARWRNPTLILKIPPTWCLVPGMRMTSTWRRGSRVLGLKRALFRLRLQSRVSFCCIA
ncbi:hypothetical protein EMPG_15270 [Blastomyces silverae]|uniref:Uncharacterized protein n=1 Tax=Blastomyces silverae TaxID=2060906 RepID=A0A0H1BDB7_9EURO|nr:hypothetical protein EMPG_15270 [Blastomyces silverae]